VQKGLGEGCNNLGIYVCTWLICKERYFSKQYLYMVMPVNLVYHQDVSNLGNNLCIEGYLGYSRDLVRAEQYYIKAW